MSNQPKWYVGGVVAMAVAASLALAEPPHERDRVEHRVGPAPRARFVRPPPPHPGFRFDARYGHAHYYPPRGFAVSVLPERYVRVRGGFFFADGVFYAARGPGFVVVAPPVGLFVPVLPAFYSTVYFGGVPYYYADDTYYVAANGGYQVVAPPPGADTSPMDSGDPGYDDQSGQAAYTPPPGGAPPPPAAGGPGPGAGVFVYPMNGQNDQQQSQDKWECHQWAVKQTGYDPTAAGGGAAPGHRADYNRAFGACLTGRGYSVK